MARKKGATSGMATWESSQDPIATRLRETITNTRELADHLGVLPQSVNSWKTGQTRPSLENLCKIADFFGITTDYLLGRTGSPSIDPNARIACDYTGLSAKAVAHLHETAQHIAANPAGLVINPFDVLLSFDCPYGTLQPEGTPVSASKVFEVSLTSYLHERATEPGTIVDLDEAEHGELLALAESLAEIGYTIMPKPNAATVELQDACDALKALFRAWGDRKEGSGNGKH